MSANAIAAGIMAATKPPTPPLVASCTPAALTANGAVAPPHIGQTPNCTANGSGGVPPYSYYWWQEYSTGVTFWIYDGTDQSSDWSTSQVVTWTFASNVPGNSIWHCTITDSQGTQALGTVSVTANQGASVPPPGPGISPTVTVTPANIVSHKVGGGTSTFTFNSTVSGGVGPFTYLWSEGDASKTGPSTTFSAHAPNQDTNDGTVYLTVTGSDGGVGYGQGGWTAAGF